MNKGIYIFILITLIPIILLFKKSKAREDDYNIPEENTGSGFYYRGEDKFITKDKLYEEIERIKNGAYIDINIPTAYIMAVVYKESSYQVNNTGDGGNSLGLMQIMDIALRQVQQTYPYMFNHYKHWELLDDFRKNLKVGIYYLKYLYETDTNDKNDGYNGLHSLYCMFNSGFDYGYIEKRRATIVIKKFNELKEEGY